MPTITAWGNTEAGAALSRHTLNIAEPGPDELLLEVLYCGLCHSDLGHIDEARSTTDPLVVAGHEIVGRVTRVGDAVTRFKAGDVVGVGCMVDSCLTCAACKRAKAVSGYPAGCASCTRCAHCCICPLPNANYAAPRRR